MANDRDEARTAQAAADERDEPGRLRSPLIEDGQPSFHWWLLLPGVALALLWALYQGVTSDGGAASEFLTQLLWPGIAIFVASTVAAYFGWRMDLD